MSLLNSRAAEETADESETALLNKNSTESVVGPTGEQEKTETKNQSDGDGFERYAEDVRRFEKDDRLKRGKPANLLKLPYLKSSAEVQHPYRCTPLRAFQLAGQTELPNKLGRHKKIRIWKGMRQDLSTARSSSVTTLSEATRTDSEKWPALWPCMQKDAVTEPKEDDRKTKNKRRDLFPCQAHDLDEPHQDKHATNFEKLKELGHVRIPPACPENIFAFLVDRDVGERPGLIDGEYFVVEHSAKGKQVQAHADVCVRGLKGMHLAELGPLRRREKTWKFCLYQAVVALLAKTQLRYKHIWSMNIDYIFDHAWILYNHIGTINVKEKQRLDDIVVYNYKYSIELELIQELKDVPIISDVGWKYEGEKFRWKGTRKRPELLEVKLELGTNKRSDIAQTKVHKSTKAIEDWFDKLDDRHRNCILRTTRFSLAFWRDSLFWYLYNPYRCDEFGYWDDEGYGCILKFCSKDSLRKHLLILLLGAYVYRPPRSNARVSYSDILDAEKDPRPVCAGNTESAEKSFSLQIFRVIYHCCQIHNLKLLSRAPAKAPHRLVKKKSVSDCPFDPLDLRDSCTIEQEEDDAREDIEKPTWLKLFKSSWAKCVTGANKKSSKEAVSKTKLRWHQYLVEESNKLFSLWGELHITDGMFEKENRGMQTYACYVVCAGMTRLMAPEYWSSKTLDVIVMCGDRYYTQSKLEAEFRLAEADQGFTSCWDRYLTSHFKIGETMFEVRVLPAVHGRLYTRSGNYLWQALERMFHRYQFGILTCKSACLGIFKFCGAYYMCDVGSFGPPLFSYGVGAAYLMRATYFQKFMTVLILTIGSPECSDFSVNPIEILKVIDLGPSDSVGRRVKRKERKRISDTPCPYSAEKKKQMKNWKSRRSEDKRIIDKTCCKNIG